MSDYYISQIYPSDKRANDEVDALLISEGIRRDANLDYTCGMYDDEMHIIATGSCFGNTLRCFAVSHEHQGEGLMNSIVSHLIEFQFSRGNTHLFLYTKCNSAKFFGDLGFYEIYPDRWTDCLHGKPKNRISELSAYFCKRCTSRRIDC